MATQEPHLSKLKIIDGKFIMVPYAWIPLMHEHGKGIPASFWVCLLVVWADVVGKGRYKLESKKTMRQFPLRPSAACKWTAALSVSGLFSVRYGFRHAKNEPGTPSVFYYQDATVEAWTAFLIALSEHERNEKALHFTSYGDVDGYRTVLAFKVDEVRQRHGLVEVNKRWIEWCKNHGIVTYDENGQWNVKRKTSDRRVVRLGRSELDEFNASEREQSFYLDE